MRRFASFAFALALALPALADDGDEYAARVAAGKEEYFKKNNIYRATWDLREAMHLNPARTEAYRAMGAILVKRGDRERGIFYLHEALRRAPADGLTQYWLGMAWTNEKKPGLAYVHLTAAKAAFKQGDFPDVQTYESELKHCTDLIADAERKGGAKFDAGAPGPAVKILVEYAANLYGDVTQLANASVEAGQPLVKDLLFVQAYDAEGRFIDTAKMTLAWSCTAGLTFADGAFTAGAKPGRETITVTDGGSKATASAQVAVLGPAVKLAIVPDAASIAQNQAQPLEARGLDEAGNTVLVPALKWTLSEGAGLARTDTTQDAETLFEPHRNTFEAPESAAAGAVTVTAATPDGKLTATAKVTIEKRKMDKLQSRAKAVSWESLSLEDALKKAAAANKPLLVEITASWCPYCKKFEEGPLSEDRVGAALKDWLAVQVDVDQHPEIRERYGVEDLPMVALLSPKGTLAGAFGNNLEPTGTDPRTTTDAFLKSLNEAKANAPRVDEEELRRVADAKDGAKMESLARWYWSLKRWPDAARWCREAIKADVKRADDLEPWIVWEAVSYGRIEEALKEAEGWLASNANSASAAQLTYYRGICYLRMKNEEKANAIFAEVQKKWPASAWARLAAKAAKK